MLEDSSISVQPEAGPNGAAPVDGRDVPVAVGARAARKADRRRAILHVAERSFLEQGYAQTSMSTIAAALGGSKTTLWSYFPSKEALFAAVIDSMIGDFRVALDQALIPSGGTAAALTRFGNLLLQRMMAPSSIALHRLIAAEAGRFPTIGETFARLCPDRVRARLRIWMEAEMAAGRLRSGDPVLAARQFTALCQAGCYLDRLWSPCQVGPVAIEGEVADAVAAFMAAWGPPGGRSRTAAARRGHVADG